MLWFTRKSAPAPQAPAYPFEMYRPLQTFWLEERNFQLHHAAPFSGQIAARALDEGVRQLSLMPGDGERNDTLLSQPRYRFPAHKYGYPILKYQLIYPDELAGIIGRTEDPDRAAAEIKNRLSRRISRRLTINPETFLDGVDIQRGDSVNRLCIGLDTTQNDPGVESLQQDLSFCAKTIRDVSGEDLIPRSPAIAFGEIPNELPEGGGGFNLHPFTDSEGRRKSEFHFQRELQDLQDRDAEGEVSPVTSLRRFIEDSIRAHQPVNGWQPIELGFTEISDVTH